MYKLLTGALLSVMAAQLSADVDFGGYMHGEVSDIERLSEDTQLHPDTLRKMHPETLRNMRVLMFVPHIYIEKGVSSKVIIEPGDLYDVTDLEIRGERLWVGDRGKDNHDGTSGQVVSMDFNGRKLRQEVGFGRLPPLEDIAITPKSFGNHAGELMVLSQPKTGFAGSLEDHFITMVDNKNSDADEKFCTLPKGSGRGSELVAGPEGSAFAGHVYSGVSLNKSIVKISPDGKCTTFAKDLPGWTMGLGFTDDGEHMLVGIKDAEDPWVDNRADAGSVIKVNAHGNIVGAPLVTGLEMPMSFDYAPKQWGPYAGQLFFVDAGAWQERPPRSNLLKPDARIYRINEQGEKVLFASGFSNAIEIRFHEDMLFVADPQGDYYGGVYISALELPDFQPGREIPDSIIYQLTYTGK